MAGHCLDRLRDPSGLYPACGNRALAALRLLPARLTRSKAVEGCSPGSWPCSSCASYRQLESPHSFDLTLFDPPFFNPSVFNRGASLSHPRASRTSCPRDLHLEGGRYGRFSLGQSEPVAGRAVNQFLIVWLRGRVEGMSLDNSRETQQAVSRAAKSVYLGFIGSELPAPESRSSAGLGDAREHYRHRAPQH
jgi:hypothetical protein